MKLRDYLNSGLLPTYEATESPESSKNILKKPESIGIYTPGFNNAKFKDQSKPLIVDLFQDNPIQQHLDKNLYDWCMEQEVIHVKYCINEEKRYSEYTKDFYTTQVLRLFIEIKEPNKEELPLWYEYTYDHIHFFSRIGE